MDKPVVQLVATTRDGRDITRGYVDSLGLLPPQDSVLQNQLGGRLAAYEEVLRDDQVTATFQQRRLALTGTEWEIEPGENTRQGKKAAKLLEECLAAMDFDRVTDQMLYGLFYGYAVGECVWGIDGASVVLQDILVRKQRRFGFGPDGSLKLLTTQNPLGEVVPERKFWVFSSGADNFDEPYGLGLAHYLWWPVYFKRGGIRSWLAFLDKFGIPTAKGTFPPTASPEEKSALLAALEAVATSTGIIVPAGMEVELLEASRGGTADYEALIGTMNAAIAKTVLSQTMTTDNGSSLSQAEVHNEVRRDVIAADANLVASSFNRTVARWLSGWNFPGVAPPRLLFRTEAPEDLNGRAERELKITQMSGFKPTLKHVTEVYGGEWQAPEVVPVVAPDKPAPDKSAPEFAEGASPPVTVVEEVIERLVQNARPMGEAWIDEIRRMVMAATDYEDLLQRLANAYPDLPAKEFAEAMAEAMTTANLAGRWEAVHGL